ncbi:MAG: hypothetical protein WAT70_04790 [Rhizobiaceae bacterium]
MRLVLAVLALTLVPPAGAATLKEVIATCGDDGERLCKGVGYGKPMQTCLEGRKDELTPACKALVDRLRNGEKVTLF